jgi:hypothetical protein
LKNFEETSKTIENVALGGNVRVLETTAVSDPFPL